MLSFPLLFSSLFVRLFIVEAEASLSYTLDIPFDHVKTYTDDSGLLERNMTGIESVRRLSDNLLVYRMRKAVPLGADLILEFTIERRVIGTTVLYESRDIRDSNYLRCAVHVQPLSEGRTGIDIHLKLRLSRTNAAKVHWLAPILGASFLSERMREDLRDMLEEFRKKSTRELQEKLGPR
ncbi:MAG: hypothetical protein QHI48_06995 [Bacteroidota bacterium]|nr:hypothetical protein [Bacteroidota bacterium]